MPHRSKESTQTKRDILVLQVGGWVDGPAAHHPKKKHTHAKKRRQRLGKTEGPLIHMISKGLVAHPFNSDRISISLN
jgi:hypothetical protein